MQINMGPAQNPNNNQGSDGEQEQQSDYNADSNPDSNDSDSDSGDSSSSDSNSENEDIQESRHRHIRTMSVLRRENLILMATLEAQELVLERMRQRTAEIQALNRIREEELLQLELDLDKTMNGLRRRLMIIRMIGLMGEDDR